MSLGDSILKILDQGVEASKEFAVKTGEKAKNMGERGVLLLEIKQLEGRAGELLSRLGKETYQALVIRNQDSVGREAPEIAATLAELENIRDTIDRKEAELKDKREREL